jgi:adenosylcobinamide-GDP ribazoletransferase
MRGLFSALAFLTSIPIPEALKSRRENGMLPWFPAAGLLIGGLLSALWYAVSLVLPVPAAAVVLIACAFLLTGAIHLDGLADCADAFYGRRDRERVHAILKDPRIGTMGGLAIGVSLLARYAALTSAPRAALLAGIPAAAVLSRSACLLAMRVLPYVSGESRTLRASPVVGPRLLAVAACALALVTAFLPVPSLASLLAAGLFWRLSWKKIGGSTGDVLGATIEIAEIVFLLALAAGARSQFVLVGGFSYWNR